jgi:hypothetical protein
VPAATMPLNTVQKLSNHHHTFGEVFACTRRD